MIAPIPLWSLTLSLCLFVRGQPLDTRAPQTMTAPSITFPTTLSTTLPLDKKTTSTTEADIPVTTCCKPIYTTPSTVTTTTRSLQCCKPVRPTYTSFGIVAVESNSYVSKGSWLDAQPVQENPLNDAGEAAAFFNTGMNNHTFSIDSQYRLVDDATGNIAWIFWGEYGQLFFGNAQFVARYYRQTCHASVDRQTNELFLACGTDGATTISTPMGEGYPGGRQYNAVFVCNPDFSRTPAQLYGPPAAIRLTIKSPRYPSPADNP